MASRRTYLIVSGFLLAAFGIAALLMRGLLTPAPEPASPVFDGAGTGHASRSLERDVGDVDSGADVLGTRREVEFSGWALLAHGGISEDVSVEFQVQEGDAPWRTLRGEESLVLPIDRAGHPPGRWLFVHDSEFGFPLRVSVHAEDPSRMLSWSGEAAFVEPPADRVLAVEVLVSSASTGVVLDPDGNPVGAGVLVVALADGHSVRVGNHDSSRGSRRQSTETDDQGRFTFSGLASERPYSLSAAGEGWASKQLTPLVPGDPLRAETVLTVYPLFGLRWIAGTGDLEPHPPRQARSVAWRNGVRLLHRPPMLASDGDFLLLPAMQELEAYPEYLDAWAHHLGAALRLMPALDDIPTVQVQIDVPRFEKLRVELELERVDSALPSRSVFPIDAGGRPTEFLVFWTYPNEWADLHPDTKVGELHVLGARRRDGWIKEVRAQDLSEGMHVDDGPPDLIGIRFRAQSGVSVPPYPNILTPVDGQVLSFAVDLSMYGAIRIEPTRADGAQYVDPLVVSMILEDGDSLPEPSNPVAPQLRLGSARPIQTHVLRGPPYIICVVEEGAYEMLFRERSMMLGSISGVVVQTGRTLTIRPALVPPGDERASD